MHEQNYRDGKASRSAASVIVNVHAVPCKCASLQRAKEARKYNGGERKTVLRFDRSALALIAKIFVPSLSNGEAALRRARSDRGVEGRA